MKILAICACPSGVAHTYMAAAALEAAAQKLGYQIKVEKQGALGIENEITLDDINEAKCCIFAIDTAISKKERFDNLKVIHYGVAEAIKKAEQIIMHAAEVSNE
jgi:fructose-specific phosphotransferase system IIB component